jgi:hypothetical protein
MSIKKLFLLALSFQAFAQAKVLIITMSYNRPDFIEIHAKTFKNFLKDEYEYVVFNDASSELMKNKIEQTCKKLGIRCFRIPQEMHYAPGREGAGGRHIDGIEFAFKEIGYDHNGIVVLVDSDMFLLQPFSIADFMQGYDISGELQGRKDVYHEVLYLSPVLVFMNMQTLPNKKTLSFEGGYIEGLACDVGAHTYYYLKNNPFIKSKFFDNLHIGSFKNSINCKQCNNINCNNCIKKLQNNGFDQKTIKFIHSCDSNIEFFMNKAFLHYRCGSNWNRQSTQYHAKKTEAFNKYINACLEQNK